MNRFIMANSQQCLGCHACEIACVMAHNDEQHVLSQHHFHPRITVIKHQQQRSAVTCHHCEDAPCARSCPNGAISHVDDSIQVNQQKCIGCKSCVVACPFGTMQIVLTPVAAGKVKPRRINATFVQGAKTVLPVLRIARRTRCNWSLTSHSPAWRNPAACAPHVRSINRGMPVPLHKKCR